MIWSASLSTHIWIFNVGRGNSAFIRSGINQGFLVDMGKGGDFCPASFVSENFVPDLDPYPEDGDRKVAQAILSHPHADHITQCDELANGKSLHPTLLTCPHDREGDEGPDEKLNWDRIKNPDGTDELLAAYRALYGARRLPLQTIQFNSRRTIPNLEYGIYYIRPPVCELLHPTDDNAYGNATSIVMYFRHGSQSILFPGDMTPEGMKHVLEEEEGLEKRFTRFDRKSTESHPDWHDSTSDQPSLRSLLHEHGLSILVAPHHGLESGMSADLYDSIGGGKPSLVVISERRHKSEADGEVDPLYQSEEGAFGLSVNIEGEEDDRYSLTTRNSHNILIVFSGTGVPKVYAYRDPYALLDFL